MAELSALDASVLETLPIGIFVVDRDWSLLLWNRTLAIWTGIPRERALGRDLAYILPHFAERPYRSRLELLMDGGPPVVFSYQLHPDVLGEVRRQGRKRARYCTASTLPEGRGLLFAVEDRTEIAALVREASAELGRRQRVEEELRKAIEVKDMLVREASHRVKNDLNMIGSLIALEIDRARDENQKGFLIDLESRVESIGLIHQFLYKGEIGADIRLDEYLGSLCGSIVANFAAGPGGARLELELEPCVFDLGDTPYVGMMVAELLTNSLKYGTRPGRELLIRLSLALEGEGGALELLIEDDGPGFPEPLPEREKSLGLSLLELFTEKLEGRATVLPGPGARILLSLPGPRRAVTEEPERPLSF